MDQVLKIIQDIKLKNLKPIYFLMGEEPYYIDKIAEYIEKNVLQESERDFNQTILYGREVTINEVVANAKRFPMMSDYQVVIVKEAQDLSRTIDQLESYVQNLQPTTILVFCYKYKTLDKRKKITKLLEKNGVVFESKKLYEKEVNTWLKRVLSGKKLNIDEKAAAMLVDFLGTDLSKIANEIDKLAIILPQGSTITPQIIEDNIGFSKDFNVFEFRKAIGERNQLKAYQIAQYFANNPKDSPIVVTTSLVFSFFSQVLQLHGLKDKNPKNIASALKINPYFVKDYELAAKNYPMKKVSAIVATLRDIDVKSKGVGANSLSMHDLLQQMLYNIFS